jgi:lysozyme
MPNPIVIDLSHHNPTPNWATLKANGTVGVIHKATEGNGYVDDQLFSRARAALAAGLAWSTYHFLRPGNMQTQIDHYLGTVDPLPGERVCLDHEDAGVSLEDIEDAVAYLMDRRPDLEVAIYSGHLIKEQMGDRNSATLAKTSLWIAQYTTAAAPSWPKGTWPQWSLWQYTDKASVSGISQPVDGNRWNGDEASLVKWFGSAEEAAPPEPTPVPEPQYEPLTISMPAGQKLIVNGREVEHA